MMWAIIVALSLRSSNAVLGLRASCTKCITSRVSYSGLSVRRSQLFSSSANDDGVVIPLIDSNDDVQKQRVPKKFRDYPFKYHEELEVMIDNISNLGMGIARVPLNGSQWVVMIPSVDIGERVRCRIYRNDATFSEADLIEVLEPSAERVVPPCKYYSRCGGCNYQHLSINAQRSWKKSQVEQLLERIGGLHEEAKTVKDVVGTNDLYGYRTKITPHYDSPKRAEDLKIGFQQRNSRIVIDIDQCMIATPQINEEYARVRGSVQAAVKEKLPKKGATLLFRECEEGVETDFRKVISQKVGDITFKFKAGEFFQNNAFVLPLMVDHVISKAVGDDCTHLIDTYCGSGLFALSAARHFKTVHGVEVSELAVEAAIANAKLNDIENAVFKCGVSEKIFNQVSHLPRDETVVIIDPPRKGCDEAFLKQLFAFNPKKLVYVSCDPSTQARDAKEIVAAGYRVVDITPFDLFPMTRHIENVMTFIR